MQAKTSLTRARPARRVVREQPPKAEGESKPARRRHGPRLPGMKGGAVVADKPKPRPYCPHPPHFPLTAEQLLAKCQRQHILLECLAEVLALMELMVRQGCTMAHLHDISHVGYATIYEFLSLESFPGTSVHVRLVVPLGSDLMEFRCLAFFCLKELEMPESPP